MSDLSFVGMTGICADCMRANPDSDRNFCEKNIMAGACDLTGIAEAMASSGGNIMADNAHRTETISHTPTIEWQLTTAALVKATGNKCVRFGKNCAHNEVI